MPYSLLLYNRKLTNTYAPPPWDQWIVQKELNHTEDGGSMSVRHSGNSVPINSKVNSHNIVIFIKTLLKSKSHIHKKSLRRYRLTFHCSIVICWRKLNKNRRKRTAQFLSFLHQATARLHAFLDVYIETDSTEHFRVAAILPLYVIKKHLMFFWPCIIV
jgi:hypothetical protein